MKLNLGNIIVENIMNIRETYKRIFKKKSDKERETRNSYLYEYTSSSK